MPTVRYSSIVESLPVLTGREEAIIPFIHPSQIWLFPDRMKVLIPTQPEILLLSGHLPLTHPSSSNVSAADHSCLYG